MAPIEVEETTPRSDDQKPHPGGRMTWQEFHDWLDDKTHAEWVDGEVFLRAPANDPHQMLLSVLDSLLTSYVAKYNLGMIRVAPYQMKLGRSSREADIVFVAKTNDERRKRTYLDGPADLVIEILSPSTRSIDRGTKFREYEAAGVQEYWMLDPDRQTAEFFRRNVSGLFEPALLDEGVFASEAIAGLKLPVERLWNPPLTHLHEIAREIGALKAPSPRSLEAVASAFDSSSR